MELTRSIEEAIDEVSNISFQTQARHPVLSSSSTALPSPFPIYPSGPPIDHRRRQAVQIGVLPDDVLLGIFDFYEDIVEQPKRRIDVEAWQTLVHVCRRWRNLVFESPRRLNLRLYCAPQTPVVRERLDIWPTLPLVVSGLITLSSDIIPALWQSNRVCQINLWGLQLGKVLEPVQAPFPELTDLQLSSHDRESDRDDIPDTFLGGSAPRLRTLVFYFVSFPGLPKLLLSATHLVHLHLCGVPHSEYLSPEAIVPLLSALSSLESFMLEFECSWSDREGSSLPPPNRSILPSLADFSFDGPTEYLEQLVTRIDTPQLVKTYIDFFIQIDHNHPCPQLIQFINRTPTLKALDEAHVQFYDRITSLRVRYRTSDPIVDELMINFYCYESHLQPRLSSIERVCNPSLHLLSTVEDLYIEHRLHWTNVAIGNDLWSELLLPFTMVKYLYLSKQFAPGIVAALQEHVGDRITEVLPNLQHIFVEELEPSGPFQENIGQFVAARQLSNHTIAISVWDNAEST